LTGLLSRLFGDPVQRDGENAALEALATGIPSASLAPEAAGQPAASSTRRQRPLALPREVVQESLAEKVLNAWLQNRHQTLYPLTVNLRTLDAGSAVLLARLMAVAMLAGARAPGEERVEAVLAWLGTVGGGDEIRQALRDALAAPEPASALLHEALGAGMAAYAYVVSLVATDARDAAGQVFLDYLAVRLALPPEVVRSADRRYRGQVSASSVRAAKAP